MKKIKKMSVKEFREKGYLQELNRQFLHPLGLALEVIINDETKDEHFGGIWDYRDDPEGMIYDLENSSKDRINQFKKRAEFIRQEQYQRSLHRIKSLGWNIEPIPK